MKRILLFEFLACSRGGNTQIKVFGIKSIQDRGYIMQRSDFKEVLLYCICFSVLSLLKCSSSVNLPLNQVMSGDNRRDIWQLILCKHSETRKKYCLYMSRIPYPMN